MPNDYPWNISHFPPPDELFPLATDDAEAASPQQSTTSHSSISPRPDYCGWSTLIALCDAVYGNNLTTLQSNRSVLFRMQDLTFHHGIASARDLPPRDVVERWMQEARWSPQSIRNTVSVYRKVVAHALGQDPESGFIWYPRKIPATQRNLYSIPSLHSRIAKLGAPRMSERETVRLIQECFPAMGRHLNAWLKGPGAKARAATHTRVIGALDRTCAAFLREIEAGREDPQLADVLIPLYLFEMRRPNPLPTLQTSEPELLDEDLIPPDPNGATEPSTPKISLLLYLLLQQAPRVRILEMYGRKRPPDNQLPVVATQLSDLESIWIMARQLYAPALAERRELRRWHDVADEFYYARTYLEERRERFGMSVPLKGKERLIGELATLPQLVCVGLPALAHHIRELGTQFTDAASEARTWREQKRRERLRKQFYRALERYVVLATFTADPMRLKNHTHARFGCKSEIRADLVPGSEGAYTVRGMTSYFSGTGGDHPAAALKEALRPGREGRERKRVWVWSPGYIDYDLVSTYLQTVRAERIIARGLLTMPSGQPATHETYDLAYDFADGGRAFFVSPRATASPIGGFHESTLSQIYGRAFHWVLTHPLKRSLPPYVPRGQRDASWAALYGLIDGPHCIRTLHATFWVGVIGYNGPLQHTPEMGEQRLSGIQYAVEALGDEEFTIRQEYEAVPSVLASQKYRPAGDYGHPLSHVSWMFRAMLGEKIDWTLETKIPRPVEMSNEPNFVDQCVRFRRRPPRPSP